MANGIKKIMMSESWRKKREKEEEHKRRVGQCAGESVPVMVGTGYSGGNLGNGRGTPSAVIVRRKSPKEKKGEPNAK